jgi:predicted Zn-dependent peptidase
MKMNKIFKNIKNIQPNLFKKNFSILQHWNQNSLSFRMAKHDPLKEFEGHNPVVHKGESDQIDYKIRKLHNGITVITETTDFPTSVNMGILLKTGIRDETSETSGACLALKNTYLKTIKHTNETINYGMVQMSGGETGMEFDEENMFFKTSCFDYDAVDMFRMIADMAFEPRSMLSANVARDKNKQSFNLHKHLSGYNPFQDNPQRLMTTAYGFNTLGMPMMGFHGNVGNIDSKMLSEFQLANITPEKTVVVANGLRNHEEFYDLVDQTLGQLNPVREMAYQREKSKYIGGEYRTFTETPDTNIILAYESCDWSHEDMPVYAVLHSLFGSGTGFSVGGPGKGMHNWANERILRRNYFIQECEAINSHFTDSGLFGLSFTGSSSNCADILNEMVRVFESFRSDLNEVDLNRAKNMLKRQILLNVSNQMDRMEEVVRTVSFLLLNYYYIFLVFNP